MLQPKKVKCTDGYGHFKTGSVYDVSENGFIMHDCCSTSLIWDGSSKGNSEFEPIYTDEELLEYAKKMYPIGTKYKTASKANSNIGEVRYKHLITTNGNIDAGPGYIYYKLTNTWAEIVSDEIEVIPQEPPLDKCMRIFKVGNIIRSVRGDEVIIKEKHLPFYEEDNRVYASYDGILLYREGVYAAYLGDTEPIKPEPKFKEGDPVISSWHPDIKQFTIVACQYYKGGEEYLYLISAPGFDGHDGINMIHVIYGKSPGTNTCVWVLEEALTLDTSRKGYFSGTDSIAEYISSSGSVGVDSFLDKLKSEMTRNIVDGGVDFANEHERSRHHQDLAKFIQDSEYDLMWGKDKADLLEVPPLRVSRKKY